MYAVNVADWAARKDDYRLAILLQPVIADAQRIIEAEPRRIDGKAIVLECDEGRAGAIIDTVRQHFKKHEFRCYHSKTGRGGWKRI